MGIEYAMVHVLYTIPPAVLLTVFYQPLLSKLDLYKVGFLVTIAVLATIPWDSYLIRNRIWTYPSNVIIGPTLFDIPAEELFFFVIQTYTTSILYLLLSKATFQPAYLRAERKQKHRQDFNNTSWRLYRIAGQLFFVGAIIAGIGMIRDNGRASYMGLIVLWAAPFLLLLWSLAYQFILGLPTINTALPILIPTLYLWHVDTLALQRGTWVIESGTKLGIHLWDGLEIEEAVFFLTTNTLVVFGLLAFDNAVAILESFPNLFGNTPPLPSPILLVEALLLPASNYDEKRIFCLQDAANRLKQKSRSFYLASSTFSGKLRVDLLFLYSWCRVADDMVDNATTLEQAQTSIRDLDRLLKEEYRHRDPTAVIGSLHKHFCELMANAPDGHQALSQLPLHRLSQEHFAHMLLGFQKDLEFADPPSSERDIRWPIMTEQDLETYAQRVAGTVAMLCLQLVFYHFQTEFSEVERGHVLSAGARMGVALQYVNIARDIAVDAKMNRVYLPQAWLKEEGLTAWNILLDPDGPRVKCLRSRLLDKAFSIYEEARGAIEELPQEAQGPMRVAVESYMEIGRVLREEHYTVKAGKATVPKLRRMKVAWRALRG
ncbi:Lycopene beta-cyclase [Mytilinidion resinicola]|uniref:Bifunctional lycopene cyclase/phytoene synthase n=1 Tax=Mytilinidion resinicola TaxID=574789 RepID=A0A6A6YHR2_9PEZI|nr:Lycopene beta-cyclase [Mytilinidion resinicola]KAF2807437.1 Lycopene beta-cyclase [Mytilinidion resinicola]